MWEANLKLAEESPDPSTGKKKTIFKKKPFVGTLNLCLETPDTMQKTKN